MADDFDLDNLLDDVLNETVPPKKDDILGSLMDEMLDSPQPVPKKPALKYEQLQVLPEDMQNSWEQTISSDEEAMKSRVHKPLSNAYTMKHGSVKEKTLEEFLLSVCRESFGNQSNREELLRMISGDKKLAILFREEVLRKIRAKVNKNDGDVISGDFPHLKKVLEM